MMLVVMTFLERDLRELKGIHSVQRILFPEMFPQEWSSLNRVSEKHRLHTCPTNWEFHSLLHRNLFALWGSAAFARVIKEQKCLKSAERAPAP